MSLERVDREEHHGLDLSCSQLEYDWDNLVPLDAVNPLAPSAFTRSGKSLEETLKETKLGGYNQVYATARLAPPRLPPSSSDLMAARWRSSTRMQRSSR
eukprot:755723-Hanusia_phi.AAC.6